MFKHRMEIVHNHGIGYRDWLFYQNVFPLRSVHTIHFLDPITLDSVLKSIIGCVNAASPIRT